MKSELSQLPDGYYFSDATEELELAGLFRQVNGEESSATPLQDRRQTCEEFNLSYIEVAVRNPDQSLVGVGGLFYERQLGVMCDFAVSQLHRSRGIGKAIIDERLRRANESGVTQLCIPVIQKTNTLSSYYLEQGFTLAGSGTLVRGGQFKLVGSSS